MRVLQLLLLSFWRFLGCSWFCTCSFLVVQFLEAFLDVDLLSILWGDFFRPVWGDFFGAISLGRFTSAMTH